MAEFPLVLKLHGRLGVVVGAGAVGLRKARALLAGGARVRLIDPAPGARIEALAQPALEVLRRAYGPEDLRDALLVCAASDDPALNRRVVEDARARGALAQAADDPEYSDFHLPAVLRRGDLSIAVSTAGRSPALAAALRDMLDESLAAAWASMVEIAAALRSRQLTGCLPPSYNYSDVIRQLLAAGLVELLAAGDRQAIDRVLLRIAGDGHDLAGLQVALAERTP